jgi:hypothetical protein
MVPPQVAKSQSHAFFYAELFVAVANKLHNDRQ